MRGSILWVWLGACIVSTAAPGRIDSTFNVSVNGMVVDSAIQPDKRILIAGWFTNVNGNPLQGIARLNPDGSVDESFDAGLEGGALSSQAPIVRKLALHTNGQIYIAGTFRRVHGTDRQRMARLNPDGTLDASFAPNPYYQPYSNLGVQPDGKLIFGSFQGIGRLNWDGSPDTNFSARISNFGDVYAVTVQKDGKVLIGGNFVSVNGVPRESVARLNADGSVDPTLKPSPPPFW